MRRVHAVALTLGFAGCADPGAPYGEQIFVMPQRSDGLRVNGPGFQMDFPADGIQLPSSLLLADTGEVLAPGACPGSESLVGVAVYPAVLAAADADATGAISMLTVLEQGPGLASIQVSYAVPYGCNTGGGRHLTGTSTFTFFPSSRIVRHDVVTGTDAAFAGNPGCGCALAQTDPFLFTSYWTFKAIGAVDPTGGTLASGSAAPALCASIGGLPSPAENDMVAVQWDPGMTRFRATPRGFAAAVYDFYGGANLDTTEREVTSYVQIGYKTASCADTQRGLVKPSLRIAGAEIEMNADGIYADPTPHAAGSFDLVANHGDMPPFAVLLNLGVAQHLRVSRNDGEYSVQEARNGSLVWFNAGLGDTESITLTPY